MANSHEQVAAYYTDRHDISVRQSRNGNGSSCVVVVTDAETGGTVSHKEFRGSSARSRATAYAKSLTA